MGRIVTIALLISGLAVAGCNTVSGAGKDVSSVGKATTKAAEKAK